LRRALHVFDRFVFQRFYFLLLIIVLLSTIALSYLRIKNFLAHFLKPLKRKILLGRRFSKFSKRQIKIYNLLSGLKKKRKNHVQRRRKAFLRSKVRKGFFSSRKRRGRRYVKFNRRRYHLLAALRRLKAKHRKSFSKVNFLLFVRLIRSYFLSYLHRHPRFGRRRFGRAN
jgi:hypothetical protein